MKIFSCQNMNHFLKSVTSFRLLATALSVSLLGACASMQTNTLNIEDQEVQQHELFDGDIENVEMKAEKLKQTRSGTSFDKKDLDDLSEEEQTLLRKRDHLQKGDLALHSGNTDLALYEYVHALVEDSQDVQVYYKIGVLHESRNNARLASLSYQRSLDIEPGFVLALERMGRIKLNEREYADARVFFEKAITEDRKRIDSMNSPNSVNKDFDHYSPFYAYTGMGVIEDLLKQHDKAIMYYQKALKIRPDSAAAESNMGYSYYLNQNLEEARNHFKRAITKDKNYSKAWRNLALVYVKKEKFTEAVNLLIDHTGDKPSAYNTVGYICMMDDKYEQAEQFFNKAIDLSPVYFEIAAQNRDLNRLRYSQSVYKPLN